MDRRVLKRLLSLLHSVSGDYNDPATFVALTNALRTAKRPAYYLAIPPSLFATVIARRTVRCRRSRLILRNRRNMPWYQPDPRLFITRRHVNMRDSELL